MVEGVRKLLWEGEGGHVVLEREGGMRVGLDRVLLRVVEVAVHGETVQARVVAAEVMYSCVALLVARVTIGGEGRAVQVRSAEMWGRSVR